MCFEVKRVRVVLIFELLMTSSTQIHLKYVLWSIYLIVFFNLFGKNSIQNFEGINFQRQIKYLQVVGELH